jgi:hypothetical protein
VEGQPADHCHQRSLVSLILSAVIAPPLAVFPRCHPACPGWISGDRSGQLAAFTRVRECWPRSGGIMAQFPPLPDRWDTRTPLRSHPRSPGGTCPGRAGKPASDDSTKKLVVSWSNHRHPACPGPVFGLRWSPPDSRNRRRFSGERSRSSADSGPAGKIPLPAERSLCRNACSSEDPTFRGQPHAFSAAHECLFRL